MNLRSLIQRRRNMNVIFASFKSRRDAISFAEALSRQRVAVRVVGTPLKVGSSCGLSVRFPSGAAGIAERVLALGDYSSFLGFYRG